jgi:hypothetical protein
MDNVFRIKKPRETKSKSQEIVSGTLDSIHQNVVSSMKLDSLSTDELKYRVSEIESEIETLQHSFELENVLKCSRLEDEKKRILEKLSQTDPVKDYYLRNADIMLKYYGEYEKTNIVQQSSISQNTFMKYLNAPMQQNGHSKKELFEEYASRMKLNIGETTEHTEHSTEHCERCNIAREEISEDGVLVCPKCGSEEYMLVVSDYPSFRDPPKERNNYAYKKSNHLNEILNQFQAKESTIIPDEVMNEVICEIKKQRIQNIAELTEKDIRELILKKLNRSKYYEHAAHILSRLNGNPPPTITPEIEEKIRTMFQEIQAPFLLYCPNDRTNFLSYSYILYKFFELLELDEYKVYFPLLKSRDRLIAHDSIWQKICDYLKWEYISSV